jgi:ABC-type Fe3+-siderophore transport system permease subunit
VFGAFALNYRLILVGSVSLVGLLVVYAVSFMVSKQHFDSYIAEAVVTAGILLIGIGTVLPKGELRDWISELKGS